MGSGRLLCVMVAVTAMVQVSLARRLTADDITEEYLNPHNAARAEVGVEPMTWDTILEEYAQNYANKMAGTCAMQHSGGPYGENLAWGSWDLSPKEAVDMWVNEKSKCGSNTNPEITGSEPCMHCTQVVWRDSVHLGCAKVACQNGGAFVICSYGPPGNVLGQHAY